jgi:hypothetical protein
MHPYATDSDERRVIPLLLGPVALVLGFLVHALITATDVDVPWWLDIPAPLALYGLLWSGFDRIAWHWSAWRRLKLIRTPDYRGDWILEGQSDYESTTPFSGRAVIRQSWTRISIEVETEHSRSHTLTASVLLDPSARPLLMYEYLSEPKARSVDTLQAHRGTAWLELASDGNLSGEYYAGRGSRTVGTIKLSRI